MTQGEIKSLAINKLLEYSPIVIILAGSTYLFYSENRQYQEKIEIRLERLEIQVENCQEKNIEILQNQVNKNNFLLEKLHKKIDE
jgi:predicted metallo-beta-lactamase superfamily hydrolase